MAAVHLLVGQRGLDMAELLGFPLIQPETFSLGGEPEVALLVLIYVDGDGIGLTDAGEIVCLPVVQAESFHRGHPQLPVRVEEDGIRTGVVEAVGGAGLHILAQPSCLGVHHHHAIGIGADPEIVFIVETKSMYVTL